MSNFDVTDDKHEKLSDKRHGSQRYKQSLDEAVERTPNRTTVKHQFEQWNQELLDHVFPLPLEPPFPSHMLPTNVYYNAPVSIRLETAYNKPNGPLDNRAVSFTDINLWLTDNIPIQVDILQHLQKGRFDLALLCFDDHYHPLALQKSPITSSFDVWQSIFTDWNGAYHGEALDALMEAIVHSEESLKAKNSGSTYYTKSMAITQSSGVGKSRLTSEFSKGVFTIAFTFRDARSAGFPPGDPEVFKFLTQTESKIDIHASVLSLLSCSLQYVNGWLVRQTTTSGVSESVLARQWHDEMAPVYVPDRDSLRSDARITFCETVVQNALVLRRHLIKDSEWRKTINSKRYANLNNTKAIRYYLREPVKKFIDTLAIAHTDKSKIPLFAAWVFDEIANLDSTDDSPNYSALRRILHSISEEPFWTIFLSTNSKVNRFVPPRAAESSDQIKTGILKRFLPFYGFPMNVEWSCRMNNSDNGLKEKELSKPMQDFTTVGHMAMFGRPLWYAYSGREPSEVQQFVQYKLLLGEWTPTGPTNVNKVFALIASRIGLDPCMNQGAEAIELAQEAVNSHLRIITGYDENNGIISTATPSEPIVADGAAMILMDTNDAVGGYVWTSCIRTMVMDLLSKGLVQKGLKGELFARLVLVLASDFGRKKSLQHSVDFFYSQPFRVIDFFDVLFGSNYHNHIYRHDFNDRTVTEHVGARRGTGTYTVYHGFGKVFETAYMNFNHFTYTTGKLPQRPGILRTLLHEMLQQHQALQLCESQEHWDLLIPMYFGSLCEPFDESKVSAVLIQVKNGCNKNTLFTVPEAIKSRFPVEQPLIQILMDLGINLKTEFRFGFCTSPLVYSITARGADKHTFGCICPEGDESLAQACISLLNELTPVLGRARHDSIARGNCGLIFPLEENKDKNSKDSDEKQEGKGGEQGWGIGGESTRVHDRVDRNCSGENTNKKMVHSAPGGKEREVAVLSDILEDRLILKCDG